MAGTIDMIQRCYTGIEMRGNILSFNSRLPDELSYLETTICYRRQTLDLKITHENLNVSSRLLTALPINIAYRGHARQIIPGQSCTFRLVQPRMPDRTAKQRDQEELWRQCCAAVSACSSQEDTVA